MFASLVATSDTLTIIFGLTATLLACIAIWATRRYNNATRGNSSELWTNYTFEFDLLTIIFLERNEAAILERELAHDSDLELGLLDTASQSRITNAPNEDEPSNILQTSGEYAASQRNNLHEVIGDALEVFSRHLRARN
ncbi:hypothetical protein N431DRAFT_69766 [Stipitochalara longipes BDJ]|nr:hypothetical protein N431DRAFT_69766 [Stipitochalara longipes BDJ]